MRKSGVCVTLCISLGFYGFLALAFFCSSSFSLAMAFSPLEFMTLQHKGYPIFQFKHPDRNHFSSFASVVLRFFGLKTHLHSQKLLRNTKTFYVYGLFLSIFTM
jgi:hypothetical protein